MIFDVNFLIGVGVGVAATGVVAWWRNRGTRRMTQEWIQVARRISGGHFGDRFGGGPSGAWDAVASALNELPVKLAEAQQGEAHQRGRWEAMLKSVTPAVMAVDHLDRVQFINAAFEKWCGRSAHEILNQLLLEVFRHHELSQLLAAVRETGTEQVREITWPGEAERVVEVRAAPYRVGTDEAGVIAVFYDITELRRLERVRQDFVANVSHELRTPLAAVRGAIETLVDGAAKEAKTRDKFLEIIREHTVRLERLVEDLLHLSSVEGQGAAFKMEAVDLHALTARVMGGLETLAEKHHVALENRMGTGTPRVQGDPFRLEQVLVNLIENAIKFSGVKGRVWMEASAANGTVELSVHDTGMGIPRKDLPRIFERFYRVDKARSRELGGTGLGLSLVKHIVEVHGGHVRVESEEGHGTVFYLLLPKAPA